MASLISSKKINVSDINVLATLNNIYSNVSINNTIKIPASAIQTTETINNSNAGIYIKDVNSNGSGQFYLLQVNSLEYSPTPYLYFNNNIVIDSSNLLTELETILQYYPLETSNIIVSGGYINFTNGGNSNVGSSGVGFRYDSSNNAVQFRNENTNWIDLVDIIHYDEFRELVDVDVTTNTLLNNQYITYNASSNLFVNSNLAIVNDTNPHLGGDLYTGNNQIFFSNSNLSLFYYTNYLQNPYITLENKTTLTGYGSYFQIANADISGVLEPNISVKSSLPNAGMSLTTKGTGDIILNAQQGQIYANSDSIVISGFVQNSIYRTSSIIGGYQPELDEIMPLTHDTILFNFSNIATGGTYYANIAAGIDGQKLNLVFNNKSSNSISVLANFGNYGLLTGTGLNTGLEFNSSGQSSSLIYLGDDISAWQILNTGANVF